MKTKLLVTLAGFLAIVVTVLILRAVRPNSHAPGQHPYAATPIPQTPADQTYTTRGRIDQLPSTDGSRILIIHHEDIPHFVNRAGNTVGMKSHAMEFPSVAPGLLPRSLNVGSLVDFDFQVRWSGPISQRWIVTRITPLPEGTTLELSAPVGEEPKQD